MMKSGWKSNKSRSKIYHRIHIHIYYAYANKFKRRNRVGINPALIILRIYNVININIVHIYKKCILM